ncbi:hypothetical protein LEBR102806_01850 [Levilactobacillus brevis]|uniref:Uncharacterized protein n=2 Tax=Levilactobacillus brevis TaxID=1580 RepID=U2PCV1_LEVBR|nr:hypothetical protein AZI11_00135 [Levilactobacillus brevis]ERK41509.1 hypothetical protein HMPREF0495_02189 [Levilactobacillus brevis ATCC 14869 = DSM 20054]ARN94171.1 hypothetical protein AZI12_00135 [Levilactobacillus brevis]KIO94284.1 hypothetical protein N624_0398 [Levilactobacillus brevis]KIO98783.1 hypothetical protein QP38_1472 [Levilactobacillus brevis]
MIVTFREILWQQVQQTIDLLKLYLGLLIPIFGLKCVMDLIAMGQLFWWDYGRLLGECIGGFLGLFLLIDVIGAAWRYYRQI